VYISDVTIKSEKSEHVKSIFVLFCFVLQVDTTFQCMMNESSLDYVSKFADLAKHMEQADKGGNSTSDGGMAGVWHKADNSKSDGGMAGVWHKADNSKSDGGMAGVWQQKGGNSTSDCYLERQTASITHTLYTFTGM
jgi:hypothetical protein